MPGLSLKSALGTTASTTRSREVSRTLGLMYFTLPVKIWSPNAVTVKCTGMSCTMAATLASGTVSSRRSGSGS